MESELEFVTFKISNVKIVNDLVGNLFFRPKLDKDDNEVELISKANAMKSFKNEVNEKVGKYIIFIKKPVTILIIYWLYKSRSINLGKLLL